MRKLLLIGLLTSAACSAQAQEADSTVTFEAVSIKPYPEGTPVSMSGCQGGPGGGDPAQINCQYVTLKTLLMRAYKVRNQEISGPGWVDSAHFNIVAKVPSGATREQVPAMFRNLLAERFKLVLHHESRPMTAYSLLVAKSGPKLKEHDAAAVATGGDAAPSGGKLPTGDDGFPILRPSVIASGPIILYRQGRARLQASNAKIAKLADALSNQLDQTVTDETELTGSYDIVLYWTPDPTQPGGSPAASTPQEASAPETSLFGAVEQQLGLRLVARKAPHDTLVIDRAERVPTEN